MPQISVIVPVYKVESYLPRCIDSILAQTFTDFELILVDDGSPDNCGVICDEYAARDNRIHVIHKENGGVSSARNAGIRLAGSDWITFVDSDDYLAENALDRAHYWSEHDSADILCLDVLPTDGDGNVIEFDSPAHHSSEKQSHVPQELLVKNYTVTF